MRLVQHKEDPAKWIQHFREQASGVKHPTRDGYTFVYNQVGKGSKNFTPIKLVSPVQQVVEQAKAEIQREGKSIKRTVNAVRNQSRKRPSTGNTSVSYPKKSRTNSHSKRKTTVPKKKPGSKKKPPVKSDVFNQKKK